MVDIVICGSGTGGGYLARKLAATGKSVVVLEAGSDAGSGRKAQQRALNRRTNFTSDFIDQLFYSWEYPTVQGDILSFGRLLGGSSVVNGAMHPRGTRTDFGLWPTGWEYDDMVPYYEEVEAFLGIKYFDRVFWSDADKAIVDAMKALGYPDVAQSNTDSYGHPETAQGIGATPVNHVDCIQCPLACHGPCKYDAKQSMLVTAIEQIRNLHNVTLIPNAFVTKVLTSGGTANGVEYIDGSGNAQTIQANLVVLAANAIGTPSVLLRSGIGPANELSNLGISVVQDLPQVGKDLKNHVLSMVVGIFEKSNGDIVHINNAGYSTKTNGWKNFQDREDSVWIFGAGGFSPVFGTFFDGWGASWKNIMKQWRSWYGIVVSLPDGGKSIGSVTLNPADHNGTPVIDYPVVQEDVDRLKRYKEDEVLPIFEEINNSNPGVRVKEVIDINQFLFAFHITRTARMGTSPATSVVDPNLQVHGINNLYITDASVFADLTSMNTNLTVAAVAAKLGDYIKTVIWGL